MTRLKHTLAVFVLVLTACAGLGLQEANTFEKKLAYAYGQNTGFRQAATLALKQQKLTADEAEAVLKFTDNTRLFLNAAKGAPDLVHAQTNLTLALGVLTQLQTYLNALGVK